MTPAGPAHLTVAAADLVPADRLEDGEIVLLAVKPSRWLALLASWPVLIAAAAVAGAAWVAETLWAPGVNGRVVAMFCSAVACTRVTVACFQWLGRLYVLTNRRVMRFGGVLHQDFWQCPLRQLDEAHLAVTLRERLVGIGSLWFQRRDDSHGGGSWMYLAEPAEALRAVTEARRRAG